MENKKLKNGLQHTAKLPMSPKGAEACFSLIQVADGWGLALGSEVGATSFR
jgi:hypothetical protein